ncbi:MAG: response regulator [Oscillospiraceae bacterium]|jgi:PAS domain S-box-containing protein|nr:response regulator [Oscillospiraceae bacterium]
MDKIKKNSVLIIDDDILVIDALTQILRSLYTVYVEKNGLKAVTIAEKHLPDVILLDVVMPDTDGYAVISMLKSSERTKHIPVIFITALSDDEDEEKGLSLGAADYITKPFSSALVKLRVKNQIKLIEQFRMNEHTIMKHKLTSEAMNIALWDMEVLVNDPASPENIITWSQEMRHMLGYVDEFDFPNTIETFAACFHPEDRDAAFAAFAEHFFDQTGNTPYDIEYRLRHKNGEYHYYDGYGATMRDSNGIPLRVSGAIRDITEKKKMVEALQHRETMLKVLNETAATLLTQTKESFEDTISKSIKQISDLFDIDRFALFRNISLPSGLHASQIYRWDSLSGGTTPPAESYSDMPYAKFAPNWENLLSDDIVLNGPVRLMGKLEAATLNSAGIISAFVVPIFIADLFWGFALLGDSRTERHFDDSTADIMRSAVLLFANAVIRSEKEREIEIMLENAPVGLTLFDENFKFLGCNEAVLKLYGVTREFYSSFFGSAAHSPEFQPDGSNSYEKALDVIKRVMDGETMRIDWVHCTPDGNPLPVELTMTRMNRDGKFIGLGYIYDMRDQVRLKEEIEERREQAVKNHKQLELLLDMLPVGIRIMRVKDGALTYANEASLKVFNCDSFEDQVADKSGFKFMPEIQPDGRNTAELAADFFTKERTTIELQCLKLGGEPFIARISSCMIDYEGELSSLASIEDVTAEREKQQMLHNIAIKEREASRAKSVFQSRMSHEMLTPMNAIMGMLQLANMKDDPIAIKKYLAEIDTASRHLLELINNLLDVSGKENTLDLIDSVFPFSILIQDVLEENNDEAVKKQQSITSDIDSSIPAMLIGDKQRLAQVINNLLENAIKFTPEYGEIKLSASMADEDSESVTLQVEVSDNGIGIPEEQRDEIFNIFEQADGGSTRAHGGAGLGLPLSKRIVELMDGKIWVEKNSDKGSKFVFTCRIKKM